MDRAEAAGLGVATAGHVALLTILSLGLANAVRPPIVSNPIEVSFVDEIGLESTSPTRSQEAPAPKLAEIEGPVEPDVAAPAEPVPQPQPKVAPPTPIKAAPPKPVSRPAPEKPATRPTGRLSGLLNGLSDSPSKSKSTTPPAKVAGAAVQASLGAEVRRQLKPHWKSPTGADVELLRTQVTATLSPAGTVVSIDNITTTGQTDSNRSQVKLHQEQAVRAIKLAAPFKLPAEYYDAWKQIRPTFDRRLSQ